MVMIIGQYFEMTMIIMVNLKFDRNFSSKMTIEVTGQL